MIGRIAAIVALVIAVVALVVMLSGGDDYEVTAERASWSRETRWSWAAWPSAR